MRRPNSRTGPRPRGPAVLGLAVLLALGGCAIRTPSRATWSAPQQPVPPPLATLPGTGSSAVPFIAESTSALPGPPAGPRSDGSLAILDRGRAPRFWQHRAAERGSLLWCRDDRELHFLYAWQPDVSRILSSKLTRAVDRATSLGHDLPGAWSRRVDEHVTQLDSRGPAARSVGSVFWGVRGTMYPSLATEADRGVIYLVSGLGGPVRREMEAIEGLQARGWWVVNLRFPEMLSARRVRQALGSERPGRRSAGRDRSDADEGSTPDRGRAAGTVEVVPDRVYLCFESAYAACVSDLFLVTSLQAFLEIRRQVEAVVADVGGPARALVGVSYGAIVAPSLLAPHRAFFDSVVLIGGGANLYLAAEDLGLLDWTRRHLLDGWAPATGTRDRSLGEQIFLGTCDLDPYHWAPGLAGMRLLQVHAMFDAIVSARCGRLLYELLDRPERWEYPYGHLLLMALLPADDVIRWIERGSPAVP